MQTAADLLVDAVHGLHSSKRAWCLRDRALVCVSPLLCWRRRIFHRCIVSPIFPPDNGENVTWFSKTLFTQQPKWLCILYRVTYLQKLYMPIALRWFLKVYMGVQRRLLQEIYLWVAHSDLQYFRKKSVAETEGVWTWNKWTGDKSTEGWNRLWGRTGFKMTSQFFDF